MTVISQTEIVTRFPDNITQSPNGTYAVLAQHSIRQIFGGRVLVLPAGKDLDE